MSCALQGKDIVNQPNRIGDVDVTVAVGIAVAFAIWLRTTGEDVVNDINGVGDIRVAVAISVAFAAQERILPEALADHIVRR